MQIYDDAINTALEMAPNYIRNLHLPDKAIGWLDTAAVKVEIDRRPDVRSADTRRVISRSRAIPEDMIFRDTTDRFCDWRSGWARASSARTTPSAPSRSA